MPRHALRTEPARRTPSSRPRLAVRREHRWSEFQLLTVGCFTSLTILLIGPWAIVSTWLFFTILGNSSSGGAVAPPLLPRPFAFVSQWLPSGATVTALRDAVYFPAHQHIQPIAVLATWAAVLLAVMLVVAHRLGRSPGQ